MLLLLLIQSLISVLVFLVRRPAHPSNYILAAWFGINGLNFSGMMIPEGLSTYLKIGFLPFLFLNGPIFYFYVKSLIDIRFRFQLKDSLHLLPFLFVSIYRLVTLNESVNPADFYSIDMPVRYLVVYTLISLSIVVYLMLILMLHRKHKQNLSNYFSTSSHTLSLDRVVLVIVLFACSSILEFFAPLIPVFHSNEANAVFWFNQLNLGIMGFLLLIIGLLQPAIFDSQAINTEERKVATNKYQRSGLTKVVMTQIGNSIINYLQQNKPYLNPEYTLENMARDLNITRQNLSQTINDELGKNFYQLINEFRVEEFKRLINDPSMNYLTFTGMAYEAGFNSKSAFYRVFKEVTGETPSAYRDRQTS